MFVHSPVMLEISGARMWQRKQQIILCLLLGSLLLVLLRIAWPFASSLALALLLATVLHPANRRLSQRLRRPALASLLTTLATVIVLEASFGFVCFTVVKDAARIQHALNQRSADAGGWAAMIEHSTDRVATALATRFPVSEERVRAELDAGMRSGALYLFSRTQSVIRNIASIVVMSVFATIFLYYLLRYGEGWLGRAAALVPLDPPITANLLRVAHRSVVANVNGVLAVALAQGLFLSLGFWFVGIGSPLLWGMFGAIASVIPFVGATLVWVPFVIGLIFVGAYWKALALGLWGGLVVGSLDNILRPWVVGAQEKEHPVLLGFAMLGGTYAFGPLGLLYGPLAVSLTAAVVQELRRLGPFTLAVPPGVASDAGEQSPKPEVGFATSPSSNSA
jgi:predicted PurR-regulated permease PerM